MNSSVRLATPYSFVAMQMVRRLEAAEILPNIDFVPAQAALHPELGCALEPIAGGYAFFGGAGSPVNHAVGMGLHGPVSKSQFDRFEEFYRSREVPAEIVLAPYVDRTLMDLLNEGHYKVTEFNSVLWQPLSTERTFPEPPAGITVRRVRGDESGMWADILVKGFADLGPLPPEMFERFAHLDDNLAVLAFIGGKPVAGAGGTASSKHGVACLFGAATLPESRRRGVQTAMTYARLQMAIDAGCDLAVVMTQPGSGSQRNAERQGFRVAYTKIVMVREWGDNASPSTS